MPATALPAAPAPLLRTPLHDNGRLALGPTLDGTGRAYYRLATPRRMRHGVIVGDAGSGVSNLLTTLVVTARAAMPVVTAYVNGHHNLTNPALADRSTVLIDGADVAETAIDALERVLRARAELLASMQAASYPAAGLPALLVAIKDAHQVFAGHGDRWVSVVRQAGNLGVGVLAAMPNTLRVSFDGAKLADALSEQLIMLRTNDISARTVMNAAMLNGAAFSLHSAPTGVGRLLVPEAKPVEFASFRLSAGGTDEMVERGRRRWLSTYPDTELDAPTRAAFGELVRQGTA